jgi:hypothetical protein
MSHMSYDIVIVSHVATVVTTSASEEFGEMFEGDSADMCKGKFRDFAKQI